MYLIFRKLLQNIRSLTLIIFPKNFIFDNFFINIYFFLKKKRFPKDKYKFWDHLALIHLSKDIGNEFHTYITDKIYVKDYISKKIGEQFIIPTLGLYDRNNISELKDYVVNKNIIIKPTHLSGQTLIPKVDSIIGKKQFLLIQNWLNMNHYFYKRERNYKNLTPRVVVEPLLNDLENIIDYKFFCYKGKAKFIEVFHSRNKGVKKITLDLNWNKIPTTSIIDKKMLSEIIPKKPKFLKYMVEIASKISKEFNSVRVDILANENNFYICELTLVHDYSGYFYPKKKDGEELISNIFFK